MSDNSNKAPRKKAKPTPFEMLPPFDQRRKIVDQCRSRLDRLTPELRRHALRDLFEAYAAEVPPQ